MIAFYRSLRRGANPTAALREVELQLMRNPRYRHPYYWAAFVVVGTAVRLGRRRCPPPAAVGNLPYECSCQNEGP
jgi:hypothetical protein